jgi:hypothetical protein
MESVRDVLLVLAGAQAFHTVSHVWLGAAGVLPLQVKLPRMVVTARQNAAAIVINAVTAVALFWWAARL